MKTYQFTKMQGSGNDFVVMEGSFPSIIHRSSSIVKICDRKYGVGADGVLFLGKSKRADVVMRIFNADGSEAEMCGNGARCAALYISKNRFFVPRPTSHVPRKIILETKAGIVEACVTGELVRIKLTDPLDLKLNLGVSVWGKSYEVDYINTGVPHAVVEVDDLESCSVRDIGRAIRLHEVFQPSGTNVNFVKVCDKKHIVVRTYERGVEDETLACGTGSVASAIIAFLNHSGESLESLGGVHRVFVVTRGQETLSVYFRATKKKITDVWLEGKAKIVFKGEYSL